MEYLTFTLLVVAILMPAVLNLITGVLDLIKDQRRRTHETAEAERKSNQEIAYLKESTMRQDADKLRAEMRDAYTEFLALSLKIEKTVSQNDDDFNALNHAYQKTLILASFGCASLATKIWMRHAYIVNSNYYATEIEHLPPIRSLRNLFLVAAREDISAPLEINSDFAKHAGKFRRAKIDIG